MYTSKLGLGLACLLMCACDFPHDALRELRETHSQVVRKGASAARAGAPAMSDAGHALDASTPPQPPNCGPTLQCPDDCGAAFDPEESEDAGSGEARTRAVSVLTFNRTTCALLEDRTVRCWGSNSNGELGDGTFNDSARPVRVQQLEGVVQLDVGLLRACAVVEGGRLRCWGDNIWDVLRVGDELDHNLPVTAQGVEHAAQVSLGEHQTCVRYTDGTLECWGYPHDTDLDVQGVSDVASVEAGYFLSTATLVDGSVRSWGLNSLAGPVDVSASRAVSSGYGFVCVLTQDASVSCHGSYSVHESVDRVDGPVPGLSAVASISSGFEHSCAVTRAGKVYCWGRNNRGQLGDGGTEYSVAAREVANLEQVVEVTCGREHSCARKSDGSIYCWGSNDVGELGDGTTRERHSPVAVLVM